MTISYREPVEITVDQLDHGLIMMALAHLALERAELYGRAEGVAAALGGHRMFIELRDLKLRADRERRKQDAKTSRSRAADA